MNTNIEIIVANLNKNNCKIVLKNNKNYKINSVNTIINATKNDITFFHNLKYKEELKSSNAGFCFISEENINLLPKTCIPLITKEPYKAFILTLNLLNPEITSNGKINVKSTINKNSTIEKNVEIQEGVIIKENVYIGKNTIIGSNSVIGPNVKIENNVLISYNCSISNSHIGKNSNIQSGAIIGTSGFGFTIEDNYHKFNHLGKVKIGENSLIGANTTIARGSFDDTRIGNNVRIDNLVQIAHNVIIGDYSIIAAQSGIAGSTILGTNVIAGGQVGISGHLIIGNNVKIAAKSGVIKNIKDNSTVGGYPATDIRKWHRSTIKSYKND
tara:strand:+ start:23 stop:1006 length:984 start_codon:yes stop_codon:yes gene_type:complete